MSEQLSDPSPAANPQLSEQGPEASSRKEADGVGAERSGRERSGAQTPSASPAPVEASLRPPFVEQPPQASPADQFEQADQDVVETDAPEARNGEPLPALAGRRRGARTLVKPVAKPKVLTPEQRLLLLDTWKRSGLPARDFAALVGVSKHTLYAWKHRFEKEGPGGLVERPLGVPKAIRVHE